MSILHRPIVSVPLGLLSVAALALLGGTLHGPRMAASLQAQAQEAIANAGGAPVRAHFQTASGWPTRHPLLSGGESLDEGTRDEVAKAVAAIPGVGGIRWSDGTALSQGATALVEHTRCEGDVEALLRARTIRFEGGSARIDATSEELIDEVAAALHPCLGSIIAITGHTDSSGPESGNLELSQARAQAVRDALIKRGIPADGLRTRGVGSRIPVEGLDASDPANRRIEFSVLAIEPPEPTPVDTPGPR